MATGTIARLNNGYGFITQEGSDKDLFFHVNELQGVAFDDLREGDKLSFEVGEGPKGPNAVNVSLVEEGAADAAPATEEAAPAADEAAA
jgi:CspA family cold shock protein